MEEDDVTTNGDGMGEEAKETQEDPTQERMSISVADMKALLARVEGTESTLRALEDKAKNQMPRTAEQLQRVVTRQEAEIFISEPRPLSEFYSWNPHFTKLLFTGKETVDTFGLRQVLPFLFMLFNHHRGAGSDLPNPLSTETSKRKMQIGRCRIDLDHLVTVTEEDIEKFQLPKGTRPKSGLMFQPTRDAAQEPLYPLARVVGRLMEDPEQGTLYMTSAHFQAEIRCMYETRWDTEERHVQLQASLAKLRAGAEKTGRLEEPALL